MTKLAIAEGLDVPPNAAVQTWGFFGRKGSGKTYAAGKLAELLLDAGSQVVVLDPIGNWYGLRLDKSGRKPSRFPVPILGGLRGDVPLEAAAGVVVAEFVVTTGTSVVLDVSQFRKGQRKQFVQDFAEELFHRKKASPSPLHLVMEEAHVFAPQLGKGMKGEERMLGAIEDIVRLGRNFGIGVSMVSQRPQSINTEVRNQCEPLVVFQLIAKHERKAVEEWMEHMGVGEHLAELSRLQTGECFFWSPAWLQDFQRTRFLAKETYDASATPEAGKVRSAPGQLKPVDLETLKSSMAATIERARATDPKLLQKRIDELTRQLAAKPAAAAVDVSRLKADTDAAVREAVADVDRQWAARFESLNSWCHELMTRLSSIGELSVVKPPQFGPRPAVPAAGHSARNNPPRAPAAARQTPAPAVSKPLQNVHELIPAAGDIAPVHQRILNAIAWLERMGIRQPARAIVAAMAGASPTSSSFGNNVGWLRSRGLVDYPGDGLIEFTEAGRAAAHFPEAPPTTEAVHNAWRSCRALDPVHVRLLDQVIAVWPDDIGREDLAAAAGASPTSSSFGNNVGRLSSLGLVKYPKPGRVKANPELLFPFGG